MKKLYISIFIICLAAALSLTAGAAAFTPALAVIRDKMTLEKTVIGKNSAAFKNEDFRNFIGADVKEIQILSLPDESAGKLMIGGGEALAGDVLTSDEIPAMRFIPSGDTAEFEFSAGEDGGIYKCSVTVLKALNFPPEAEAQEVAAIQNVTLFGKVSAIDPDGDGVTYRVEKDARHGKLTLDAESGEYVYYPDENFFGKDKFTYSASDKYGNAASAVVSLKVERNKSGIVYADMRDSKAYVAAVRLGERGILVGEKIGDERFFYPEKPVTRGEFLMMAMNAADIDCSTAGVTSFADDEKIPESLRGCVCTAEKLGIVLGVETENGICFMGDEPISAEQAAVIISRILSLGIQTSAGDATPDEGQYAMKILGFAEEYAPLDIITRQDAAMFMYKIPNN